MIIKDFHRQHILLPSEVARLVNKLPKLHLVGLQTILYKPPYEFSRLQIPVASGCKGAFYPEFSSIIIYDLTNRFLAPHILYHEIGHYVFHRILDSYAKKKWSVEIYASCSATTAYGNKNAVEDFAEAYALYAVNPSLLAKSPPKYRYMRDQVF